LRLADDTFPRYFRSSILLSELCSCAEGAADDLLLSKSTFAASLKRTRLNLRPNERRSP